MKSFFAMAWCYPKASEWICRVVTLRTRVIAYLHKIGYWDLGWFNELSTISSHLQDRVALAF